MMNGLDPKHEKFNYGINIMNSLNELTDKNDPANKRGDYKKFIDEMNQMKIDMMEARGELDPDIVK
jgi:hypothetical protein